MKPASEASAIEAFPHVIKRICMLWGTHDLDQYITHLMTDTRDGQRRGFPVEVTAELLFLAEINKLIRAIDLARKMRIPLGEAYQKIDKQDRGGELGDPIYALSGRDGFAREEKEIGVKPQRPPHNARNAKEETDSTLFWTIGKLLIALILLVIIWRLFR